MRATKYEAGLDKDRCNYLNATSNEADPNRAAKSTHSSTIRHCDHCVRRNACGCRHDREKKHGTKHTVGDFTSLGTGSNELIERHSIDHDNEQGQRPNGGSKIPPELQSIHVFPKGNYSQNSRDNCDNDRDASRIQVRGYRREHISFRGRSFRIQFFSKLALAAPYGSEGHTERARKEWWWTWRPGKDHEAGKSL